MGNGRSFRGSVLLRAASVFAALTLCGVAASQAAAAPADRGGDPVVLKGSAVPGMAGVAPNEIVGFKWDKGWVQVPVQVDERHTINVRQLYPDEQSGYVGDTSVGFDLEVYADVKTRSGADADATFDSDDELVFMGGDAGDMVPTDAAPPEGVDGQSGVMVAVDDPVAGGNALLYLFRSDSLDPAAGKDYVDYDFKLTALAPGQNLLNDYGYQHSINPEDSRVSTANYELHSFDRWMDDELKVKTAGSTGADILDREVAQATKTGCGRSEYTFSGRWTEDSKPNNDSNTDDEGTFVAVIDGPVRAIRSYMGANSGPYVQREHVYYADQEVNTIFLRVHPMTDLYTWTDYAPAAIGMTYRDSKNTGGVPVDGNPDTLVPTTTADVANGAYAWQQLSGPQGSVSTVIGSDTDLPEPSFGNYYLDDSTPTDSKEVQCGGDGQSIGSSGFGILGPVTPNTDPRLGNFNNLTVKRTRYFGPPSDGAAQADAYEARVEQPLTGSASPSPIASPPPPPPAGKAKLRLKVPSKTMKVRRGKKAKFKIRIRNTGNTKSKRLVVCVVGKGSNSCGSSSQGGLGAGKKRVMRMRFKVKRRLRKGKLLKVRVSVRAKGANTARRTVRIRAK